MDAVGDPVAHASTIVKIENASLLIMRTESDAIFARLIYTIRVRG